MSEVIPIPASFPHVSIVEQDNHVFERTQDSDIENHASLMYEINVYSNKETGKKTQCKAIIAEIDNVIAKLGFTRTLCNYVPNLQDLSTYRMVSRYKAVVSKQKEIFRR